jgi:hypothetical protein
MLNLDTAPGLTLWHRSRYVLIGFDLAQNVRWLTAVSDHSGLSANRAGLLNAQSWRLIIVWLEVRVLPAPPRSPTQTEISRFIVNSPELAGFRVCTWTIFEDEPGRQSAAKLLRARMSRAIAVQTQETRGGIVVAKTLAKLTFGIAALAARQGSAARPAELMVMPPGAQS